ncbi:hypothetical protein K438DRAFT_1715382 [Mycena galopus ATCC 62051]|nr:hypothetical protein K438DRAFT_1715382 [Mycena galopus ATCC 62051]
MSFDPYAEIAPASPPQSPLSPNRPKDAYRTNTSELKNFLTLPSLTTAPASSLRYYPASLCLLVVWIVYIILLLWLLESAVNHGPKSFSQSWAYTELPSLLLTVFAQGHVAITAIHLSRVSVSALHSVRTSPSTWAEIFWICDGSWQGPVGILSTLLAASHLRVRPSMHFILCALTCLAALVTPIILSRAFPIRTITVYQNTTFTPSVLSTTVMGSVDGYTQVGMGVGSWATGLSVSDAYNSSVFLPPGSSRDDDPSDFFFAGSVEGMTATLPGLRLSGQCVPIETTVSGFHDFPAYCEAQIPNAPTGATTLSVTLTATNLTLSLCYNSTFDSPLGNGTATTNVGYIYLQSNNGSLISSDYFSTNVSGVIRCDSNFAMGRATLSGSDGTYSNFTDEPLYNPTQGGEPLQDPLEALLYYFTNAAGTTLLENPLLSAALAHSLGYTNALLSGGAQNYNNPTLEEMATAFWRGISYSVAGIGLLSRSNDVPYNATNSAQLAVYVRKDNFASGAYALLAIWLLLLAAMSARSFRRTFSGSFNSYLTARLVLDRPDLMGSSRGGDFAANENLREPFGRVGKDESRQILVT